MKLIINNLRMPLEGGIEELKKTAAGKIGLRPGDIRTFKITRESVDARRKPDISRVYSVAVEIDGSIKLYGNSDIRVLDESSEEALFPGGGIKIKNRPVIIGSGPAGMFAGLLLARHGYKPLIFERGECVEDRTAAVNNYWTTGNLNPESNVQFGEGGAGTFSDGKLTTRINDRRCDKVLEEFVKSGASEEILYKAKPHIGSDVLKRVTVEIRKRIEGFGGEIRFKSRMTSLKFSNSRITGVIINGTEEVDAEIVILAIGHSARDTFQSLLTDGVVFQRKPFSIGVRIEHPQQLINQAQYGSAESHPSLGAADYQLFHKTGGRTAYSFCMCPGGLVVAAASESGTVVTNGMSEFARDRENANSAFVVSVGPDDFGGSHPLAGVEFQRTWERKAFEAGGKDNSAPVQRLKDFFEGNVSRGFGSVKPSYTGSVRQSDLNGCLPLFVTGILKESAGCFDRKLKGFAMGDAVLTGVEARTSSPVRIPRSESLEAEGIGGLYPAGEGAGYAGGIMSAAVDGMRVAEQIIRTYYYNEGF
ncbi:MAG: hypothetical protein FIA99_15725 [Ruminiclostridium sp.]|nr:hypothetical protein [Ruminiclostridium sp.]